MRTYQVDAPVNVREPVAWFARIMELQLKANDGKEGWYIDHPLMLLARLIEEVGELSAVLSQRFTALEAKPYTTTADQQATVIGEAADVANFAMMIADVMSRIALYPKGDFK